MRQRHQVKVWQMDEYYWFAGRSARECVEAMKGFCDYDEDDLKNLKPQAMSEDALKAARFYLDEPFCDPTPSVSFYERLSELIAKGEEFPTVFASTEF